MKELLFLVKNSSESRLNLYNIKLSIPEAIKVFAPSPLQPIISLCVA